MGKTANPKEMTPQMEGQVFYVKLFFIVIFFLHGVTCNTLSLLQSYI